MRKLTFEEINSITFGAVKITQEEDGVHFFKCTDKQNAAWKALSEVLGSRALTTTGVHMEFVTDSQKLRFLFTGGGKFDLWIDGVLMQKILMDQHRKEGTVPEIELGEGEKKIMIALPSHSVGILDYVEIDEVAFVRPTEFKTKMLFIGDSITQGVLVDEDSYCASGGALDPRQRQCYADDACGTYAWYTAEALGLRPIIMGYGAVGATRAGSGEVPPAPEAYPYNFTRSPITRPTPDFVLVNHGANDRGATAETYREKYSELLDRIRESAPNAKIVSLSAFCGGQRDALEGLIREYNEKNGTDILFVDSTGWVPVEPLHPIRSDHKKISEHLAPILKKHFNI
jgi:lysophospholipase L1-like esterase